MSFKALGDRIFIKADKGVDKVGSIFLPPSAVEKHRRENGLTGIIRYIGPGMHTEATRWPMPDVKAGDRVIYLDQPWTKVEILGEELLSVAQEGVIAVVENDR